MKKILILLLTGLAGLRAEAQVQRDKAILMPTENAFYDSISKSTEAWQQSVKKDAEKKISLKMDFTGVEIPSISEFTTIKALPPVSQGITGTCWCFATSSFFEAEMFRTRNTAVELSKMYTVYWQYVEKARAYVLSRGSSLFDEGSQGNAVLLMMKKYGAMPNAVYNGMKPGQPFHDHSGMVDEMKKYLESVKAAGAWNENVVLETIKSIMDWYIGTPPTSFNFEGKTYTPQEFLPQVVQLNPDDYVSFLSFVNEPYWKKTSYKVPDNWWKSADYNNVPLDDFVNGVKMAVESGYSVAIGGDNSNEAGMYNKMGVFMVPSFDIPSAYIDENARLFRFLNGTTSDDHLMHIVGYVKKKNGYWFLVKDSGSGGHNNASAKGYWYMHEDYLKLKMTTYTVHKDAVKPILSKMKL